MHRIYNWLSILLIGLIGYFILAGAISYNFAIQKPLQGGWNSYRMHEFGIQFGPYLLLFLSLIATRLRRCPKWLFLTAVTVLFLLSAFVILGCINAALVLNAWAWINAVAFVCLMAAHMRFISEDESSRHA